MDLAEAEHEKFVTKARKYTWSDYKMDAVEEAVRLSFTSGEAERESN